MYNHFFILKRLLMNRAIKLLCVNFFSSAENSAEDGFAEILITRGGAERFKQNKRIKNYKFFTSFPKLLFCLPAADACPRDFLEDWKKTAEPPPLQLFSQRNFRFLFSSKRLSIPEDNA